MSLFLSVNTNDQEDGSGSPTASASTTSASTTSNGSHSMVGSPITNLPPSSSNHHRLVRVGVGVGATSRAVGIAPPPTAGGGIHVPALVPPATTSILTPIEGRRVLHRQFRPSGSSSSTIGGGGGDLTTDTGSDDDRGGGESGGLSSSTLGSAESPEANVVKLLNLRPVLSQEGTSRSSSAIDGSDLGMSSMSSVPGTRVDLFTQMKCGTLTLIVSSHVFSIVCEYFGSTEDYASLSLVNHRVRDAARYYCDHILINILSLTKAPGVRHVRSVLVDNVGLWHYGRENFQDGLILFIPPPGAVEVDPESHPIRSVYEDIFADHLSLRNTYELDYDSNGTQQKFRFSTAWLPTPRSAFQYFESVRFLELMDFLNGLDWYLSFLDPVLMYTPNRSDTRYGSPAPSTPNSTMSTFSESLLESLGGVGPTLSPLQSTSLLSGSQGGGHIPLSAYQRPSGMEGMRNQSLADLEEVRFVNCRVSMEDVKTCVQTQYAARRLVVVESSSNNDTYSCDSSPRRKTTTRCQRMKPTTVIPSFGELWGTTSEKYTQIVDLARCNTQQLDDLLSVGTYLRRVVVRCLLVVDQSSLEAACHSRLESLSLTGAPESAMREGSIELRGECFPRLRECVLVGCPVTAIGPVFNSLKLLHIAHCPIDTRAELTFPNASVVLEGIRLCSPLTLTCFNLTTCQVSGMDLHTIVGGVSLTSETFTLVDLEHNSTSMVLLSGSGALGGGGPKVSAIPNTMHYTTTWPGGAGVGPGAGGVGGVGGPVPLEGLTPSLDLHRSRSSRASSRASSRTPSPDLLGPPGPSSSVDD